MNQYMDEMRGFSLLVVRTLYQPERSENLHSMTRVWPGSILKFLPCDVILGA